ncbi:hypothetical protein ACJO5Y_00350 [Marinobacter sp. GN3S48]|uniref:CdiA C-terminal domain-containing protein n=1 Tax=Marinobacter sp. GN3S48 TaxID=3382302 RepID=UPI00387B54BC
MSYQLYVTGGYGFTEAILPTLLHPSNAVDIARDYFIRGYQGQHIDLPPDADVSQTGNLTNAQKRTLLEDLQEGRLVLSSRYEPGFALFTDTQVSPDTLRNDLPPTLRQLLQQHWPGQSRGGAAAAYSDSLAPANEPITQSPEPPASESPVPGAGPYNVILAYRWPDGTGVAGLPFTLATDDESVTGTLDANGEARIEGLNGRFAFVRLSSDASDDEVGHQRRAIQHALTEILKREQGEADALEREYQQMPWYQRTAVSTGAAFQGVADAGIGLLRFVDGMGDLATPTLTLMDGLKSAWDASEGSPDTSWYESYRANYKEARHQRWVKALGFNPSDISREDVAQAYELTNLVMSDPMLRESLNDFVAEYARIQHHTEVTYFTGAVAFDLILMALLAVATGGAAAGAAAGRIRHAGLLASLGKTVKAYGAAVRKQRLRYLWRNIDLKKQNHLETTASKRVEGQELKPAKNVPSTTLLTPKQGILQGKPELPHPNANADMVRSLTRQNESAELLANRGLDVKHLPNSGRKGGNPDLDIGGRPADVYSPKSKNPNTIWDNMTHKVEHQSPDIVLNLTDSPITSTDMLKFLHEKPVNGLENLYLIKGDEVLLKRY